MVNDFLAAEQIPDAVARAANDAYEDPMGVPVMLAWKQAIAAALNAWPGMSQGGVQLGFDVQQWITLPLPEVKP